MSVMLTKMPFLQPSEDVRCLRGGCHCGRNRYVVNLPEDAHETCRVVFNTNPTHQISLATPLPGFLRIPLAYYHSSTHAAFDDETAAMISRVYEDGAAECTQRRFCGFCGTPLTYWCENPASEGEYILITLGSLYADDLNDLADMGFVSDGSDDSDVLPTSEGKETTPVTTKDSFFTGVPWFDALIQDSPLRRMQRSVIRGMQEEKTTRGTIRVEWEISEWNDDASSAAESSVDEGEGAGMHGTATHPANKRKLQDLEDAAKTAV